MKPNIDVFLIVDHSSSTRHIIGNINEAIRTMCFRLRTSPYLSGVNVSLTFIRFNHDYEVLTQCEPIGTVDPSRLTLTSSGATDPGRAILKAIELGTQRYSAWATAGEESFHPLYFFFTDGYPDAGKGAMPQEIDTVDFAYAAACSSVREMELNKKGVFVAVGFQGGLAQANMGCLHRLTVYDKHCICIDNNNVGKLEEFFTELIPHTVVAAVTDPSIQIDDGFMNFQENSSDNRYCWIGAGVPA